MISAFREYWRTRERARWGETGGRGCKGDSMGLDREKASFY
jgi:hypothetical protein